MKQLEVLIEKNGRMNPVGTIYGNTSEDAVFRYSEEYSQAADATAISLNLPLQEAPFDRNRTKTFFDGLLPEGFTRRTVAQMMHIDENDYLSILSVLGRECIGAIKIADGEETVVSGYEKLSTQQIKRMAEEGTTKSAEIIAKTHLSLTGASGKAGLYYNGKTGEWYLPLGDAPSTHIVKQSHVRLESIVANEQLCLMTARALGLNVPDSFIVNTGKNRDEDVLFATQRFDRIFRANGQELDHLKVPFRLHQEDFAQAMGIAPAQKYENEKQGYLHAMFEMIRKYSADPVRDQRELWDIVIFDYLAGNTDNHIKNISFLYSPDLTSLRLAPAYDVLSTASYESSTRDMAFYIGSECRLENITRDCFEEAAKEAGLGRRMALQRLDLMADRFEEALSQSVQTLKRQRIPNIENLKDRIMELGGIANMR